MIEKNIDKKLANRISYQIRYKRCSKGKFGRGVQICEGGPNPRRVQNPLWHLGKMSSTGFRSVLAVPSVVLDEAANFVVLVEVIWSNG